MPTQTEPALSEPAIELALEAFQARIQQDGAVLNSANLWHVALDPEIKNYSGDELLVLLSMASLTRDPSIGCISSNKQIRVRAEALRILFGLANKIGWPALATRLGVDAESLGAGPVC